MSPGPSSLLSRLKRPDSSFGGQILLTTATNGALLVIGLVSGSIVARLLGPTSRGELAAIQTWSAFIALLASLGLPDAVVYFSGREPRRSASALTSAVALMLLAGVPAAVIGYLAMPVLLSVQSTEVVAVAQRYVVALIFIMATAGMLLHPLRGRNDFVAWNGLRVVAALLWLAAVLGFWATGVVTSTAVAAAYLVSLVAFAAIGIVVLRHRVPGPYRVEPHRWQSMTRYGLPSALSSLPQTLNLRLDQMLIAATLPSTSLGYYAIAVAWSAAIAPLLQGIGGVLFPRVAMTSSKEEQVELVGRGTRAAIMIAMVMTIGLLLATPLGIRLVFGSAYTAAIPSALILVVAGLEAGMNGILEESLRGLGNTKAVLSGESIGLVATALSLALLLGPLEILGAALASLIGYTFTLLALVYSLSRLTGRDGRFFLLPSGADRRLLCARVRTISKTIRP